jgi:glc operon protein GlcG
MKGSMQSTSMTILRIACRSVAIAILFAASLARPQQTPNSQPAPSQQPIADPYQLPIPYGAPVSLDNAKKAAAAAAAEAAKNGWTMVVAIVDPDGTLVYYEKMDNTQNASAVVAIDKARSAALFKRPTRAFEDLLAQPGGDRYLKMEGAIPIEGGIPLVMGGKIVGAIGVSGGKSAQDAQCAQMGANVLK